MPYAAPMDSADSASALAWPLSMFDDPALEADYQATRERFLKPPVLQQKGLLLLGSLALFAVAAIVQGSSLRNLVILVAVLFIHELGHYLGMLAFGYRDVTMFFVPLFGAAAAGRRGTVSQTREAIVLLLGPGPGILLGVWIAVAAVILQSPLLKTISAYLVLINALNLLPIVPFDGGRLGALLLFSRWAWTERLFVTVTTLALAAYGLLEGAYVLGVIGLFGLLMLPVRNRVMRVAAMFRRQEPPLVNDPATLDDATARSLFLELRAVLPANGHQPKPLAECMAQALEAAAQRPPSLGMTLLISLAWGAVLVLAIVGVAIGTAVR